METLKKRPDFLFCDYREVTDLKVEIRKLKEGLAVPSLTP